MPPELAADQSDRADLLAAAIGTNDDLDIAAEPKQDSDEPVGRESAQLPIEQQGNLRARFTCLVGNLHLRQALQVGLDDEAQSLPLVELAKQSYRDLLRRDPNDWDARYNLERTLRLAPEDDDDTDEDTGPPDPREHERSTIADPRMALP